MADRNKIIKFETHSVADRNFFLKLETHSVADREKTNS